MTIRVWFQDLDRSNGFSALAYPRSGDSPRFFGLLTQSELRSGLFSRFYKNGSSQGSIDISSVYSSGDYIIPALPQSGGASQTVDINFGAGTTYAGNNYADGAGYGNFSYAVPSGYYALCTANLNTYG